MSFTATAPRKFQSTHPVGGATARAKLRRLALAFQSTHPVGGATRHFALSLQGAKISIHAPLTGCDASHCSGLYRPSHFNPRTPHGVRPKVPNGAQAKALFQSTHPSRGATHDQDHQNRHQMISIHAPLTGCDGRKYSFGQRFAHFNPRTPHGVRPEEAVNPTGPLIFQSTHPSRGATWLC